MRLFHFNIVCSDFDKSYDFYTQVVGLHALTSASAGTDASADSAAPSRTGKRPGEGRCGPEEGRAVAELLGFEGSGEWRGCFLYWGSAARGPYIDLLEWKDPLPPVERSARNIGLARVAFEVDDMNEQLSRLEKHSVPLVSEPKEVVLGVTRLRVVCFRDPDGVLLEFVEFANKKAWGT